MLTNETLQLVAVVIILLFCMVWIIRRIVIGRKRANVCLRCSLYEQCKGDKSKLMSQGECDC